MSTQQRFLRLNALRIRKIQIVRAFKDIMFISLGVSSAAFGLKGFLLPNEFLDGGVVGISLLMNRVTEVDVSILLVVINIPFIIIAYEPTSPGGRLRLGLRRRDFRLKARTRSGPSTGGKGRSEGAKARGGATRGQTLLTLVRSEYDQYEAEGFGLSRCGARCRARGR
jgi:hypothetical protein